MIWGVDNLGSIIFEMLQSCSELMTTEVEVDMQLMLEVDQS